MSRIYEYINYLLRMSILIFPLDKTMTLVTFLVYECKAFLNPVR